MEFNLQQFLTDMEGRLGGKIDSVDGKVDQVITKVSEHETRIVVVETSRRTIRWLVGTLIGGGGLGAVAAIWDYVTSHWK